MPEASWPNSLQFAPPSPWRSFVVKPFAERSRSAARAPTRRLDESKRAACANWWALGIALGLFAGSTFLHPAQGQSLDYLKAGTALLRKRHGGAVTPTAGQHLVPQESERTASSPERKA